MPPKLKKSARRQFLDGLAPARPEPIPKCRYRRNTHEAALCMGKGKQYNDIGRRSYYCRPPYDSKWQCIHSSKTWTPALSDDRVKQLHEELKAFDAREAERKRKRREREAGEEEGRHAQTSKPRKRPRRARSEGDTFDLPSKSPERHDIEAPYNIAGPSSQPAPKARPFPTLSPLGSRQSTPAVSDSSVMLDITGALGDTSSSQSTLLAATAMGLERSIPLVGERQSKSPTKNKRKVPAEDTVYETRESSVEILDSNPYTPFGISEGKGKGKETRRAPKSSPPSKRSEGLYDAGSNKRNRGFERRSDEDHFNTVVSSDTEKTSNGRRFRDLSPKPSRAGPSALSNALMLDTSGQPSSSQSTSAAIAVTALENLARTPGQGSRRKSIKSSHLEVDGRAESLKTPGRSIHPNIDPKPEEVIELSGDSSDEVTPVRRRLIKSLDRTPGNSKAKALFRPRPFDSDTIEISDDANDDTPIRCRPAKYIESTIGKGNANAIRQPRPVDSDVIEISDDAND